MFIRGHVQLERQADERIKIKQGWATAAAAAAASFTSGLEGKIKAKKNNKQQPNKETNKPVTE